MFRLVFLTFFGTFRGTYEQEHHLHESPFTITLPLIVLAILAVAGGIMGLPEFISHSHWLNDYLSPIFPKSEVGLHGEHANEFMLMGIATTLAIIGIVFAYSKYVLGKQLPAQEGELKGLALLVYDKYRIDELYNTVLVRPISAFSVTLFSLVDKLLVDGGVEGLATTTMAIGKRIRSLQSGNIGFYLLVMVLGACAILGFVFIR